MMMLYLVGILCREAGMLGVREILRRLCIISANLPNPISLLLEAKQTAAYHLGSLMSFFHFWTSASSSGRSFPLSFSRTLPSSGPLSSFRILVSKAAIPLYSLFNCMIGSVCGLYDRYELNFGVDIFGRFMAWFGLCRFGVFMPDKRAFQQMQAVEVVLAMQKWHFEQEGIGTSPGASI